MTQYISKDALIAEIDRRLHQLTDAAFDSMIGKILIEIKDFLNTLEVKEINIKNEVIKFMASDEYQLGQESGCILVAKHFFELGLKAQKGE